MKYNRRQMLAGSAVAAAYVITGGRASAAEFNWKFGFPVPDTHPAAVHAKAASEKILEASSGRVSINIFPNSQLGTSPEMLSQVRSGALEMMLASSVADMQGFVPQASISGLGYLFKDYSQIWAALDGPLGEKIKEEIRKPGDVFVFDRIWDSGYRQVTNNARAINVPDDMKGMKLRVPQSALWTSLFESLGTTPTGIPFAEVYSALQTGIVDGQENPLAIINSAKLYEVQKYCSLTNHMWDGWWLIANKATVERLPEDLRAIVSQHLQEAALGERDEIRKLNETAQAEIASKGMQFNTPDFEAFRGRLVEADFYKQWSTKFDAGLWDTLEGVVGKLT